MGFSASLLPHADGPCTRLNNAKGFSKDCFKKQQGNDDFFKTQLSFSFYDLHDFLRPWKNS
jgi:hypothetical protein